MRVAILTANARAGDATGGQVAEKLAFFLDRGADVRVFAEDARSPHPAVRTHCRSINPSHPGTEAWEFLTTADLIVAEYGHAYPLLHLLPALAGGKPRILLDYHGVTPPALWGLPNGDALEAGVRQRGLVWCADAAVTHSRFTRRELLDPTGYPPERCATLPLPVDDTFFTPSAGRTLRERLNLQNATVLLFVGRLAPNKRAPLLVEALDRLRGEMPPPHAVFIGDDTDVYQLEKQRCRERADALGLGDRVHFLGKVCADQLREAYRSADVLVIPSVHEGFCLPVAEAMASGLPVVAARAGALPETVGGAGLTFRPDDADDLVRRVRRVLNGDCLVEMMWSSRAAVGCVKRSADAPQVPGNGSTKGGRFPGALGASSGARTHPTDLGLVAGLDVGAERLRVAVVATRYGTDFVGGAETSLRTMAETLHQAGHHVEVFTTCTRSEDAGADELPEGTVTVAGIAVHRYRTDRRNAECFGKAAQAVAERVAGESVEWELIRHALRSGRLIGALGGRQGEFDAVITGPYLSGLALDVVGAFADKTLLVPCFHDEPFARLECWRRGYERVGGMLFHSPEEQCLAEAVLGYNVPGGACVGTFLAAEAAGDAERGRKVVGAGRRYLVYCGRYLKEKGLSLLLDYARRYGEARPGRFTFAFMGRGEVTIPRASWARDLGYVAEADKCDVLAGADALVHLSPYESLSLAALEAWTRGVPVLAEARCEVMVGHLARGGGGQAVNSYEAFAAALDDLWDNPERWRAFGRQGREYARARYGARDVFLRSLEEAIRELRVPLAERMRRRGRKRAADFTRGRWRERFAVVVEETLDRLPRPWCRRIEIAPRGETAVLSAAAGTVLVPVRVTNRGTHPEAAEGPGRVVIRSEVVGETGTPSEARCPEIPLPGLFMPGQTLATAVPVAVPSCPGEYEVRFRVVWPDEPEAGGPASGVLRLTVEEGGAPCRPGSAFALAEAVQSALAEAQRLAQLPDGYTDVTQGLFARGKAWVKRKLLGNFQRAYVDVLSRRQSAFNRRLLDALQELVEYCATLEGNARRDRERVEALEKCLQTASCRPPEAGTGVPPAAHYRRKEAP